jgi:hypothetical protein
MNLKIELIWLADKLDRLGMGKEANVVDRLIKKGSANKWLEDLLEQDGDGEILESPGALMEELSEEGSHEHHGGCGERSLGLEDLLRKEDRLSEA